MSDDRTQLLDDIEQCRESFQATGNFAALFHALECCQRADTCPAWVARAVFDVFDREITDVVGAVGRWVKPHRRDVIDFVRAELIHDVRQHGFTWDEAYNFAAEYLAPTPAGQAGPEAMAKSWQRVKQRGGLPLLDWSAAFNHPSLPWPEQIPPAATRYESAVARASFHPPPEHAAAVRQKYVDAVKRANRWVEIEHWRPTEERK